MNDVCLVDIQNDVASETRSLRVEAWLVFYFGSPQQKGYYFANDCK